jgi:hypothetical protein
MIIHQSGRSRLRSDQVPRIAVAQKRELAARYSGRLQHELIGAKLAGRRSVEARALLRTLRLNHKRPMIGRMVLAVVISELPNRELLPEVLQ